MLYKATILEHWSNNTSQLCHKWDHRSSLIIKIIHLGHGLILLDSLTPFRQYRDIFCLKKRKQSQRYNNLYSIFCFSSFPSSAQIILLPLGGTVPGTQLTNQMKTSTCRVQVVQSSLCVYAGIWFGCVWCALGTANARAVAGGLECAQKPSASTPGRPQSKECVKFNSRWRLPESSASGSPALVPLLN